MNQFKEMDWMKWRWYEWINLLLNQQNWGPELSTLRSENEWDNQTIQSQGLSEDQNQNHSNKNFILLGIGSYSCITHDTDG